jgi:hypothetical protein
LSVLEHLKQTDSGDAIPKAPPLRHTQLNKPSSTSSPPPTARRVYRPPSPTESRDSGFQDDYPIRIERERKPYTAAPGTGKIDTGEIYSRGIRRANSPSFREIGSYSGASADSGFHDDTTRSGPTPVNKYGPSLSSSSSSFVSQPQPYSPGSSRRSASFPGPPPGPPPIKVGAGDKRAGDQYERREAEGEIRDAEKWGRYQENLGIEPVHFDRPYERGPISVDAQDPRRAPSDEWYRSKGRAADDIYKIYP